MIEAVVRPVAYSEGPNLATLNMRQALRRYQVEALKGSIQLRGTYKGGWQEDATRVVATPGADGVFEIAIDEFWSTWVRPDRKPFDECLAAAAGSYSAFLNAVPAAPARYEPARRLAAYVNWASTVEPCGLLKRHTMLMSKNWMCNVWSWDQCFNAMALAAGQPHLALDQMLVLADHQDRFGAYPDSINDIEIHYNFSKPPVHGWAFGEVLARLPQPPDQEVMETIYASLSAQARWWLNHRRMAGSALPYYLHGNDSGWDNSTMFDRGVPLNAPDLAALLVLQMDALAELADGLTRQGEGSAWRQGADHLLEALLGQLWQGDRFVARLARDGSVVECESLIPWLPLILGTRLPEDIRGILAKGIERHLTRWGLATEHPDSPTYKPNGYWRGPIWAPATWIAVTGLVKAGYTELADTISERFCDLCSRSGFAENFDALTGEPLCDPAYTWTASVFLLLAERLGGRT
jgi:glycogen debranching enzyme